MPQVKEVCSCEILHHSVLMTCLRIIIANIKFLIHLQELDLVASFPGVPVYYLPYLPYLLVLRHNPRQILIGTVLRWTTLRRGLQRHLTFITRLMVAVLGIPSITTSLIIHGNHSIVHLHQIIIHLRPVYLLSSRKHLLCRSPLNPTLQLNLGRRWELREIPLRQLLHKDIVRHQLVLKPKRFHLRQYRLLINYSSWHRVPSTPYLLVSWRVFSSLIMSMHLWSLRRVNWWVRLWHW